jgi:hypothetical protein
VSGPVVPNLTSESPTISTYTETLWLPVWKDKDGKAIMNSAKSLPIKPVYEPHSVYCYRIEFVRSAYGGSKVRGLLDTVNSGTYDGAWLAGEAWLSEISTEDITVDSTNLKSVTVIIRCLAFRKWNLTIPEVGYFYLDTSKYKSFKEDGGQRILGKLNSSGGQLSVTSDLVLKEFDYKRSADFSGILS